MLRSVYGLYSQRFTLHPPAYLKPNSLYFSLAFFSIHYIFILKTIVLLVCEYPFRDSIFYIQNYVYISFMYTSMYVEYVP